MNQLCSSQLKTGIAFTLLMWTGGSGRWEEGCRGSGAANGEKSQWWGPIVSLETIIQYSSPRLCICNYWRLVNIFICLEQ